jgi:hypothetical protein
MPHANSITSRPRPISPFLRHPAARAHLHAAFDRLVQAFDVDFFMLDYSFNIGPGTDYQAFSVGSGTSRPQPRSPRLGRRASTQVPAHHLRELEFRCHAR